MNANINRVISLLLNIMMMMQLTIIVIEITNDKNVIIVIIFVIITVKNLMITTRIIIDAMYSSKSIQSYCSIYNSINGRINNSNNNKKKWLRWSKQSKYNTMFFLACCNVNKVATIVMLWGHHRHPMYVVQMKI